MITREIINEIDDVIVQLVKVPDFLRPGTGAIASVGPEVSVLRSISRRLNGMLLRQTQEAERAADLVVGRHLESNDFAEGTF